MVALPGLLIEYLITGSGFLVAMWAASALGLISVPSWLAPEHLTAVALGALIPTIYVVGMAIDFLSKLLTGALAALIDGYWHPLIDRSVRPILWPRVRRLIRKRKTYDEVLSTADIYAQSERLALQYEVRSSRDRIARGAFLNVSIFALLAAREAILEAPDKLDMAAVSISLSVVAFFMWRRFARLSARWKYEAGEALKELEARGASREQRHS